MVLQHLWNYSWNYSTCKIIHGTPKSVKLFMDLHLFNTLLGLKIPMCTECNLGEIYCLMHVYDVAIHDDVIKWKHFLRYWPFVRGIYQSPVNSPHKGQWRGALMFSLICAWMDGWVNNGEVEGLRCHRAHYDVTVMTKGLGHIHYHVVCGKRVAIQHVLMSRWCLRTHIKFNSISVWIYLKTAAIGDWE